jgi:hypothetical protein
MAKLAGGMHGLKKLMKMVKSPFLVAFMVLLISILVGTGCVDIFSVGVIVTMMVFCKLWQMKVNASSKSRQKVKQGIICESKSDNENGGLPYREARTHTLFFEEEARNAIEPHRYNSRSEGNEGLGPSLLQQRPTTCATASATLERGTLLKREKHSPIESKSRKRQHERNETDTKELCRTKSAKVKKVPRRPLVGTCRPILGRIKVPRRPQVE